MALFKKIPPNIVIFLFYLDLPNNRLNVRPAASDISKELLERNRIINNSTAKKEGGLMVSNSLLEGRSKPVHDPPFPTISHLLAAVKTAILLADRHADLSISVLVMNPRRDAKITSATSNSPNPRLTFVPLPHHQAPPAQTGKSFILAFTESQKVAVRDAVAEIASDSTRIAGFVLDMFCTSMIDVAEEFGSPSYIFFSSSAANLGLFLHLQSLRDDQNLNLKKFLESDAAVAIPSFVNQVPARVWPHPVFDEDDGLLDIARDFRRTKGIIVNSFLEFETHAIQSFSGGVNRNLPPVFPVGPLLEFAGDGDGEIDDNRDAIVSWLDQQPNSSVVYLCFGSGGCFDRNQVMEIARALEKIVESGEIRFLWSLRKPPQEGKIEFPGEYENPGEILPEGFLERTAGVGRVIGWSPQMAVLSHAAVGGFVSHGGWNSTLESLWCGVPMAIWPLYAEQQVNAFEMVVELGMAVEVKMDYRRNSGMVVAAETVEAAVRRLMEGGSEIREKVKAYSGKSKEVLKEGGSSNEYLGRFIGRVFSFV